MSIDIKKVYSDNPYVDELVYYTMQLGIDTVLKINGEAEKYETLEILKKAGTYISCIEGNVILGQFDYFPYEVLTSTVDSDGRLYGAGLPDTTARAIVNNPKNVKDISSDAQKRVLEAMKIWYIEHYEEENTYYRMLNGLPPIGYPDIYVDEWRVTDVTLDLSIPLHKMSKSTILILDNKGILDDLFNEDPKNRGFIKHLGLKKIDVYLARKASNFDPLYVPDIDSDSIREMYIDKLNNNRTYVIRAVYSEAYKYNSDYYDNIMAIFIVLITLVDIISRVQEFITRKEIFDIRSCEYLFQSYGVEFFEEIPLRYQIAMVKNIHTLLKYKSSAQCMVDICSLFGFDNIKVFKYYLLKDRNIDLTTGDYSFTGDDEKDFTLKFIKLPLEDNVNDYIRTPSNHIDYDEITDGDPTWDGGLDHEEVKKEILKEAFNIVRTKYISIDTIYDIAKMSAEQTYFFNMLYDNYEKEELLKVRISFIDGSRQFDLADTFSMLTALSYYYYDIKDTLMDTQEKVLYVNGFNFKADLAELAASLERTGYTLHAMEQLKAFQVPDSQIPSFDQMMNMYVNNLSVRDELIKGMQEADNLRVFLVYRKLYNALMTVELTMDHFKNPETGDFYRDADGDATYTEYFKNVEPLFYYELMDIYSIEDVDDRKQRIATMIDNIVLALENYINLDEFQSLLYGLPAVSAEAVKQYIAMVINFYKSYKVDFLGLNTIYYLDDRVDGLIRIIDDVFLFRNFTKNEEIFVTEIIKKLQVNMAYEEYIKLLDTIALDIETWANKQYDDYINIYDDIPTKIIQFIKYSVCIIGETYGIHISRECIENLNIHDLIGEIKATVEYKEKISLYERIWIYYNYRIDVDPDAVSEFDIENVVLTPTGSVTVLDSRIKSSNIGLFIPDLSVDDLVSDISVTCADGSATITGTTSYDIVGVLKIKYS